MTSTASARRLTAPRSRSAIRRRCSRVPQTRAPPCSSRPSRSSRATPPRSSPRPKLALQGITGARARAERLTRYVNALLDKKPTVSLPSAREVLRTKVGDCNEHTALYVAMARAAGIPARIAVGLVFVRGVQGAFYYHAWPEVYLDEGNGRGMWLPVDPDAQPVPGRRHASSSCARRPRQAGGDPSADRIAAHHRGRPGSRPAVHADPRRARRGGCRRRRSNVRTARAGVCGCDE